MPKIKTDIPLKPPPPGGFPTGAVPTPRSKLANAIPFIPPAFGADGRKKAPEHLAYIAPKLSYWGNDRYGICVTAEEAYCKGCTIPGGPAGEFMPESMVISWARGNGWLNGASLTGVMDDMKRQGFPLTASQRYNNGGYKSVDWEDESILQEALAVGPVKIAMRAAALPSGAGSVQGWYVFGDNSTNRSDHSIPIVGYGRADYLYDQLELPLPSAIPASRLCYLLFTWSTLGIADHAWLMGCTDEAWVRSPTTVGVPPLPIPQPPIPPPPPPPPPPPDVGAYELVLPQGLPAGRYLAFRNDPV